ncbi:Hypothetical protein HDN1F_14420 [gamma proteobacterium HdN1]|nr:Hypothetical protein HDN1F_14420 [gamma proteobacterium HdN1]
MIKDIFAVLVNRILARGGNLIVLALLARYLSTADMGVYGLTSITSYTVIYFASLGLRNSSAFFLAKGLFDEAQIKQALLFSWPLIGALAFASMLLLTNYNLSGSLPTEIVLLASTAVIPMVFVYIGQGIFLANKNIRAFNQSELFSRYFLLGGVVLAILLEKISLSIALLIFVASQFAAVFYVFAKAYSNKAVFQNLGLQMFSPLLPMIKQGGLFSLTLAFATMNSSVSVYFSNLALDATATALIFAALKLTELVSEAATSASLVSYSHGIGQTSRRRALHNTLQAAWVLFVVVLVGAIALIVLADPIVRIIYGEKYLDAVAILPWLALGLPFHCHARVVNSGLCSQGEIGSGAFIQGISVLINIGICIGVATSMQSIVIALMISRVFCFFAYSWYLAKMLNVGYIRTVFPRRSQWVLIRNALADKTQKIRKKLRLT